MLNTQQIFVMTEEYQTWDFTIHEFQASLLLVLMPHCKCHPEKWPMQRKVMLLHAWIYSKSPQDTPLWACGNSPLSRVFWLCSF